MVGTRDGGWATDSRAGQTQGVGDRMRQKGMVGEVSKGK